MQAQSMLGDAELVSQLDAMNFDPEDNLLHQQQLN